VKHRFTVHDLRYTFTDLVRLANVDAVVRRALTGHVTEEMQRHYSTVGLDEKRAAVAGVPRLVPPEAGHSLTSPTEGGVPGGVSASERRTASGVPLATGRNYSKNIERDTRFELATFSLGTS